MKEKAEPAFESFIITVLVQVKTSESRLQVSLDRNKEVTEVRIARKRERSNASKHEKLK